MITDYVQGAQEYADLSSEVFYAGKNAEFKALVASRDAEKDKEKKKGLASQVTEALKKMPADVKTEFDTKKKELWTKVGVKENNGNIEIKLAKPCPYFVGLTAFPVFYPANEKFHTAHQKDYTLEAAGLNSNGPWIVKEWKHKDSFKLEKNPNYWNKANVKIDNINLKVVTDVATRTNLLKTGALDGSAIQANDLKSFQDKAVLDQYKLQDLIDMPDYTIFYLEFNFFSNPITANANIRKAMTLAMDRKGLVENVTKGDTPGLAIVPDVFPGLSKSFREENGKTLIEDNQKEKAKEALKAGLAELKLAKLPVQDVLVDQSDISKKISEKIQSDLKDVGIDINIIPVAWGDKLTRLKTGAFGICASGWGPDYADPMTFLDLFESTNGNNHGKYKNPKYDELIQNAKKETDAKKRMGYLYDAEKILISDSVVAPEYFRTAHWTFKNYLTGVVNRGIGPATDFYYADIDMSKKSSEKGK
jgi:oligopeptide transport system substrate-binding protein